MEDVHQKLQQVFFTVEGWLSLHEGELLFQLARLCTGNRTIVEIGSWKGRSTICLGFGVQASKKKTELFAIDPHEGIIAEKKKIEGATYKEFLQNIKTAGIESLVTPIRKTSVDAAKRWTKKIDLLFLDGLHDEINTRQDYETWQQYLSPNGIVAFHDAFCGEVGVWKVITSGPFKRHDVIDIGTVGSILYFVLGQPSFLSTLRVFLKQTTIRLSYALHSILPKSLENIIIHKFFRIILLTPQTLAVYNK